MKRRDFIQKSLLVTSALAAAHCGIQTTEKTRVVILGFDGANWPTIDPLIKKGKLPFLKQLKEDSAWAYFKTCKPTKSNVVWSSIASGKNMMKHGIMDFAFLRKSGIKVPYSKSERMAPMIWQILDEYRRRSMVLNWWVSHPPDPINGVMISDYFRLVFRRKPDKINEFEESIHPASYFRLFRKMVERNNYRAILKQTGLADFPALFYEKYPGGNIKRTVTLKNYPGFVQQDDLIERASWYLYNKEKFDFFATYFRLPDIAQHSVTHLMDRQFKKKLISAFETNTVTQSMIDEAVLQVSDILESVYRHMEKIIKDYITHERNRNTTFLIMSDHGFTFYPGGYNHYGLPDEYPAPDGILMVHGPGVKRGRIEKASIFDIAPTILYLLNHPVGQDMDGRPLKEIFQFQRQVKYKRYTLKKDPSQRRNRAYDEETLRELESLGYISSEK